MAVEILYLVRHSKAEGAHPRGDRHRFLSDEGVARIVALSPEAQRQGFQPDFAVSSSYRRALQTRELFLPGFGADRLATLRALSPESDPQEAFEELKILESQGFSRIAVFTHNPLVTSLAELLLTSGLVSSPEFHTPTLLAIGFESGLQRGAGRQLWVLNP